jgi:outer membrane protein
MKKVFQTIALLLLVVSAVSAQQKIGYLNAQAILADMTEMKAADSQLEAFGKQLANKDSIMVVGWQTKAQAVAEKEQKGEIAPIELEKKKKELEAERQKIAEYEQDMQQQMATKRKELLQPILDRVNKAIAEVSKEQAYTYVIDVTSGSLLFADEKNDLQNAVRAKLGMPAAAPVTPAAGAPAKKN